MIMTERMKSSGRRSSFTVDTATVLLIWMLCTISDVESFSVARHHLSRPISDAILTRLPSFPRASPSALFMSDNDEITAQSAEIDSENMELAWRYAKKPLLRIGSKGATLTHGNSLRQLLDDHTVVKVKINTRKYGTLIDAFQVLRDLSVEAGAPKGIELIQAREGDKVVLFGLPGTLCKIQSGEFPPPLEEESSETNE